MFCSACGQTIAPGQNFCPQCGRPVAPNVPPVPGLAFQLENYSGRIRALAIVWYVYAGITLLFGFAALTFAKGFLTGGGLGPWMHGATPPSWIFPAVLQFAWIIMIARTVLAVAAAWGLMEHTQWGRILAIIAAILNMIHVFPLGLALGIWTLVTLLGYRNSTLYEQLGMVQPGRQQL